jgi:tetratricopeptide (TPR) repeat protein
MMKYRLLIVLFFLTSTVNVSAQQDHLDSLKLQLKLSEEDTTKVNLYATLAWEYAWTYPDTSLAYSSAGLKLARKLNFASGEIKILDGMSESFSQKGNHPKALEAALNALHLIEKSGDSSRINWAITAIGNVYFYSGDYQKAIFYYLKSFKYIQTHELNNKESQLSISGFLGETYFHLNMLDSALFYLQKAYDIDIKSYDHWTVPYYYLGAVFSEKGKYEKHCNIIKTVLLLLQISWIL